MGHPLSSPDRGKNGDIGGQRRDIVGKHRQERAGFGREVLVQGDLACGVEHAQVQTSCVQVAAGVESVLLVVEAHHGLLGLGGA